SISQTATLAPARAKRRQNARPKPPPAPVTTTASPGLIPSRAMPSSAMPFPSFMPGKLYTAQGGSSEAKPALRWQGNGFAYAQDTDRRACSLVELDGLHP